MTKVIWSDINTSWFFLSAAGFSFLSPQCPIHLGEQTSLPSDSHPLLVSTGILPEGWTHPPPTDIMNELPFPSVAHPSQLNSLHFQKLIWAKAILFHLFFSLVSSLISHPNASAKALFFFFLFLFHPICRPKFYSYHGLGRPVHPFRILGMEKYLLLYIWYKMCPDLVLHGWFCAS